MGEAGVDTGDTANFGQDNHAGVGWMFYSLTTLVETMFGQYDIDLAYTRLTTALFFSQMAKAHRWNSKNVSTNNDMILNLRTLGGGMGRHVMSTLTDVDGEI